MKRIDKRLTEEFGVELPSVTPPWWRSLLWMLLWAALAGIFGIALQFTFSLGL